MAGLALQSLRKVARSVLDFALPPRCAGCGDIIDESTAFAGRAG
jgi:hypothetical protein